MGDSWKRPFVKSLNKKKMTTRIKQAIDVLLDAINNGTLAKGACQACAVGNLVAHGMGVNIKIEILPWEDIFINANGICGAWANVFLTSSMGQQIKLSNYRHESKIAIDSTDFTWQELAKIEFEFEQNTNIKFNDYPFTSEEDIKKDQIKGLEAVVKVMLEMDEIEDVTIKEVFTEKVNKSPLTLEKYI